MTSKRIGRPPGPRPGDWKYPYDRARNLKHRAYSRARAQEHFRGQQWNITPEQWQEQIWPEHLWLRRGREPEDLCMHRIDTDKPWAVDNVSIMTRRAHLVIVVRTWVELIEIEPGVLDLSGQNLLEYTHRKQIADKFKGKYKK